MTMEGYTNRGTVMHLTLHGCTIINQGTIMHLDGENNQIDNKGSIMHNDGGRVIIMGSGTYQSPQPHTQIKKKVVYRDRIVYKDRPVYNTQRIEELEQTIKKLKKQIRTSSDVENIQRLENKISYYEGLNFELKRDIDELHKELGNTERLKLLKEIENLKDRLKMSENRERTSRKQQYEKGYQAGVVDGSNKKKEVFDWDIKPTKEQAETLMKQLRIWLDCED